MWAEEVPGIGEAFTFRPAPGFVNVFPLTDEIDPVDRIPSSGLLTQVQDYINNDRRYPFGRPAAALAGALTELRRGGYSNVGLIQESVSGIE